MFAVESYAAVRRFVFVEGHSRREAARAFGLNRETVAKMCRFSLPPGYTRTKPVGKPKLGPLLPVIEGILKADQAAPVKQRHTAKRIFERLRDEHSFAGGYTVVKDYVRICRARGRETFVPLAHPPGHAQVDFGEAVAIVGGVRQKIHFFCMDVPQSDACFVKAYPRETTEAFLDGHVSAFAFFDGVPLSILYDNLKIAVARICGDGKRERTRAFTELVSHYLFQDRFGRPAKGNDKGKVEGRIRAARFPAVKSFDTFDFTAIPGLNKMLVLELARSEYILRRENIIALGNSGTGKTHVALALGLAACQKGFTVAFTTAAALVSQLLEARDERRLLKLQRDLASVKLLIIDELGYVPLSSTGAELLFETFSQRYERGSTIVTSNLPFEDWTQVLGSARLTGALLDRLTHHVSILTMNGDSYRLKQSAGRRRATPGGAEQNQATEIVDPVTGEIIKP